MKSSTRTFFSNILNKHGGVVLSLLIAAALVSPAVLMTAKADESGVGATSADVIYVTVGGNGNKNGTSWSDAYPGTSLDYAVKQCQTKSADGCEVWTAQGTYARTKTLELYAGVRLYGGFAGTETAVSQRDISANATVLSGDAAAASVKKFSIVTGGAGAKPDDTVIDGFTMTGGTGTKSGDYDILGGGMYNAESSPTVANCTFSGNRAGYCVENKGGGYYNYGGGCGMSNYGSSPAVTNCKFSNNSSDCGSGGGMYNVESSPTVANCMFSGNSTMVGGGIYNYRGSLTVTDCKFINNSSAASGGGIDNNNCSLKVAGCTFKGNKAKGNSIGGGGIHDNGNSPTITNCTFSGNSSETWAGGLYCGGDAKITNCTFSGNSADGVGGGMSCANGSPTVTNCTFSGNSAGSVGGGMSCANASPTVANCTFSGNSAYYGGGMFNESTEKTSPVAVNSIFWDNRAKSAPEIYNFGGGVTLTIKNCVVSGDSITEWNGSSTVSSDITSADPKITPVDAAMHATSVSTDVYICVISGDGSSAAKSGTPAGTVISGDVKVPVIDQRGWLRPSAPQKTDVGAYDSNAVLPPSFTADVKLDAQNVSVGKTITMTVSASPDFVGWTAEWKVTGGFELVSSSRGQAVIKRVSKEAGTVSVTVGVTDSQVIKPASKTIEIPADTSLGGTSSCNAGFGVLALLALAPLAVVKRKK